MFNALCKISVINEVIQTKQLPATFDKIDGNMRCMFVNYQQSSTTQVSRLWVETISHPNQPMLIVCPPIFADRICSFREFLLPCFLNLFSFEYNEGFQGDSSDRNTLDYCAPFSVT